jgi:hypothetical protein
MPIYGSALYGSYGSGGNTIEVLPSGGARLGGGASVAFALSTPLNIEQELRAHLLSLDEVTDLVGNRIHPDYRPQGKALPIITTSLISREHRKSLATGTGVAVARIQLDSWSADHTEGRKMAEALRLNLEGFTGYFEGGALEVKRVRLDNEISQYDEPTEGTDEVGLWHIAQDFMIKYIERVPYQ